MSMTLIEHIEVTAATSTISFGSIPIDGTYTDLYLVCSLRNSINANYFTLKFNSSSANFTQKQMEGSGSSVAASSTRTDSIMRFAATTGNYTVNTFASASISIPNYASSNNKSFSVDTVTENNGTQSYQCVLACLWSQTSAISSIDLVSPANFDQYSSATLYGIRKYNTASAPKATGGIISFDSVNSKWVHTFTASGTLTPSENLTGVEYLVIAGGGGGGRGDNTNNEPGGGGAGGYRSSVSGELSGRGADAESSISLTASTGYAVVVGAGGSGSSPANGTNSSFFGITSLGGGYGAFTSNVAGGADGGSGGGGAHNTTAGGAGTLGQGHDGGTPTNSSSGAGGGGAGQAGQGGNYITAVPAHGGDGIQSSITGSATYRAGGGAGFVYSVTNEGGLGGGASHSGSTSEAGSNGSPGTGGGGSAGFGNAGSATASGGNGGSGVVIVRYDA